MPNDTPKYLSEVSYYYSSRVLEYGQTPEGADWNGRDSQFLRFKQLCKVIPQQRGFSLNDLGCGYGALLDYLNLSYSEFTYSGFDISPEMIKVARDRYRDLPIAQFLVSSKPAQTADYGVASGIFNVRLNISDRDWESYISDTLRQLDRTSVKGFAFNCLTSYSDAEKMQNYLYYADPTEIFDFCKKEFSRKVALLHDYDLYEFTILVKKS